MNPGAAQEPLQRRTRAGAGLAHQERLAGELCGGDATAPDQRVLRPGDQQQRVPRERPRLQRQLVGRGSGQRQVHLVLGEQSHHLGPVVDQQTQLDGGVAPREQRQQLGREVLGRRDHGDGEPAAGEPGQPGQGLLRVAQLLQHALGVAYQLLPGRGQPDPPPPALEEREPGDALQLPDLHRDRWLCDVNLARGAGKRERPGGGDEDLELAEGDVSHATLHKGD